MYKSDIMYNEMKEIEKKIKNLEVKDVESIVEYFKLYTNLIYNYQWLGSINDIYDENALVLRGNGYNLNGPSAIIKDTTELLAAFPDLDFNLAVAFATQDNKGGYKLWRRFYMAGTNLGYSKYGAPTGKKLESKKSLGLSMSNIEVIDGKWKITSEYTIYSDEYIREVCTSGVN